MKIGFDAKRIMRNSTGLGNYGRTLVNNLAELNGGQNQLLLYAPDKGREELSSQMKWSQNMRLALPQCPHYPFYKSLWRSRFIVKDLKADDIDLFHGLSGELPWGIKAAGIPSVVTIHDLIFMRHPEYYKPVDVWIYTRKFHQTCREADRIIAISECTKRDIMELGHVDGDKIDVIYQSCAPRFSGHVDADKCREVMYKYGLSNRFVLNVGTIEERKNVLLAVRSLPLLSSDIALVIVGRATPYAEKVNKETLKLGLEHRVKLLHGVPDEDLAALYQMAECFVYPSRYEGFGIPIVEAIQTGLPVVAAKGSCLEEAGGPDSIYVDPDDVEGMAHAINSSLKGAQEREGRISRSREYVRRFEGHSVAVMVRDIYRQLCSKD